MENVRCIRHNHLLQFPMTASDYATAHRARFVRELREFLRFPSISTLAAHRDDVHRTAEWLADHLQTIGAQVCQVIPTSGHPVVYAEFPASVPDAPTLLFTVTTTFSLLTHSMSGPHRLLSRLSATVCSSHAVRLTTRDKFFWSSKRSNRGCKELECFPAR